MAVEQEPESGVAWQLLGALKEEQKDFNRAIECLESSMKVDAANAPVLAALAKLYHQTGRIPESCAAYTQASTLDPANAHFRRMMRRTTFLQAALLSDAIDQAIVQYRQSAPEDEPCSDQEIAELLQSTFSLLSGFGHTEAAARVGRKQLALSPASVSVNYLLKAVAADPSVDCSPPEYVVEHFDAFAAGFDAQLVGALGYDIPQKLCGALRRLAPPDHLYETLDAGCGTGLCGPLLRPISRVLTGVDLSPKMLEQAARKSVYDTLVCEELAAFLRRSAGQFDLIVAADLMIYFGDLEPLFNAAAAALRSGGLFAFSFGRAKRIACFPPAVSPTPPLTSDVSRPPLSPSCISLKPPSASKPTSASLAASSFSAAGNNFRFAAGLRLVLGGTPH